MVEYGIDGLLLHVADLPGVKESAIVPSALPTIACKVDTHRLSHTLGEDVSGLHIGLAEEKHSHFHNVTLGKIGSCGTARLLHALVCMSLRVALVRGHGRIALSTFIAKRDLSLVGARGNIGISVVGAEAIAGEGTLCVVQRVVFVDG
jgi:hypothetical protein